MTSTSIALAVFLPLAPLGAGILYWRDRRRAARSWRRG